MRTNEALTEIACALERYRKDNGLTQASMAEKLGILQGHYSEFANGRRELPKLAMRNAALLGIPADVLLGLDEHDRLKAQKASMLERERARVCLTCPNHAALASAPPAAEPFKPCTACNAQGFVKNYATGATTISERCSWCSGSGRAPQPAEPAQPATQAGAGPAYDMAQIYDAFWRSGGQDGAWLKFAKQLQERSPPAYPTRPTEQPSQDANPPR